MSTNKRVFRYLQLTALLLIFAAAPAQATPGDLDLTFGSGGKVLTQIGTSQDEGRAVAIQPDGKIVVAGFTDPGFFAYDFAILRYETDGTLDQNFGNLGKVILNFGMNGSALSVERAFGVTIQPDGKIVAVGQSNLGSSSFEFASVRLMPNGVLDASFGIGGISIIPTSGASDSAHSVGVFPDGKIAIVGESNSSLTIVKLNPNGTLDSTFNSTAGPAGMLVLGLVDGWLGSGFALLPSGMMMVAGNTFGGNVDLVVLRITNVGTVDGFFGGPGGSVVSISSGDDVPDDIVVQPDNKVLVIGRTASSGSADWNFSMVRFNTDGTLDASFDGDGKLTTAISANRPDLARAGLLQPDGKIIVAGSAEVGTANDPNFALVRYNQNGSIDTTFGANGIVTTGMSANDNDDVIFDIGLQADGKIVAAGQANSLAVNSAQDIALARYQTVGPTCFPISMPTQTVIRNAFSTIPVNIALDTTGQEIYSLTSLSSSIRMFWIFSFQIRAVLLLQDSLS